jgi:O-antigen ligase
MLSLVILLPAYISLRSGQSTSKFGKYLPDKFILIYLFYTVLIQLRETSVTDTLRQGFNSFIDVFLPYYVCSRSLKQLDHFKEALSGFVFASLLVAAIVCVEFIKSWLLYSPLPMVWGLPSGASHYLLRGDILRARGSLGHPITLGYVMAVAIGFYVFIKPSIRSIHIQRFGLILLILGIIASLSRGPWIGALVFLAIFIATGRNAFRRLLMILMATVVALPLISVMPGGERVVGLLPFVGNIETGNIDYRKKLLDNSLIVIERNLFFGSVNFADTPEMQEMMQGEGIIDIVNSYLRIGLAYGLVGVCLFVGVFGGA